MRFANTLTTKTISAGFFVTVASMVSTFAFAADISDSSIAVTDASAGYIIAENNIIETIAASEQHSDLTYALGKTNLASTLAFSGPFTVLAPMDSAFESMDSESIGALMGGSDTSELAELLKTHVISGKIDSFDLTKKIEASTSGQYELTSMSGATLTAMIVDDNVVLRDAQGNISTVVAPDLKQKNGIVHVVDTVLLPS